MANMQTKDASKVPYVGSRISLISKSGIRYVGTLYTIDTKASTVALKDVRSFGTEGRHRDAGPVQPSDQVYSYIIFRGPDIMDLQFLTDPPPAPSTATKPSTAAATATATATVTAPAPAPALVPTKSPSTSRPASSVRPVQSPLRPPAPPNHTHPPVSSSLPMARAPAHNRNQPRTELQPVQQTHVNGLHRATLTPPTPRAWGPPPGRRQRRRGGNVPDEDFDFESMNRQFEKAVALNGQPVEKRYDKTKSFFDSLVSEKEVRGERNAAQRRATDLETFGEAAVRRGRRGRGRGRGRGRRRIGNDRLPTGQIPNANA